MVFSQDCSLPFWLLSFAITSVTAQAPVQIPWSNNTYGLEGPWHAVSVKIGTPPQNVDLFPAGAWSPNILSYDSCVDAAQAGVDCNNSPRFFHANKSSSADHTWQDHFGGPNGWVVPLFNNGTWNLVTDTVSVPVVGGSPLTANTSLQLVNKGNVYLGPSLSQKWPYSLGTFGLGAPETALHPLTPPSPEPIGNLTVDYFYADAKRLPSASYGLHYGSVTAGIKPSLFLGGYDKSRVLGNPISLSFTGPSNSADPVNTQLTLGDIIIGTADGESPWNYNGGNQSHFLKVDNSSTVNQNINVGINPGTPFLMLPSATCQALAQALPLSYNSAMGMYFWDTGNSTYNNIVKGANYLGFRFTQLGSQADVTIKLPFQLLVLTLDGSVTESRASASYFPCYPHDNPDWTLGRAFLQGAFFGGNWMPHAPLDTANARAGSWMLAQAPGPGMADVDAQSIGATQTTVDAASMTWEDTWKDHWTPMSSPSTDAPTSTSQQSSSSSSSSSGLSSGAKAGIAVAITLVGLGLIGATAWYFYRRRQYATPPAYDEKRGGVDMHNDFGEGYGNAAHLDGTPLYVDAVEAGGEPLEQHELMGGYKQVDVVHAKQEPAVEMP